MVMILCCSIDLGYGVSSLDLEVPVSVGQRRICLYLPIHRRLTFPLQGNGQVSSLDCLV